MMYHLHMCVGKYVVVINVICGCSVATPEVLAFLLVMRFR